MRHLATHTLKTGTVVLLLELEAELREELAGVLDESAAGVPAGGFGEEDHGLLEIVNHEFR